MFLLGCLLIILGLFGVARGITLPTGVLLATLGAIIDVIHLFVHTFALVF